MAPTILVAAMSTVNRITDTSAVPRIPVSSVPKAAQEQMLWLLQPTSAVVRAITPR
mgnify:CR=1 FL=1